MNLLFPFFLAGMAAIAIPILLHFRRQPPQKTVAFSSLMFLEQTPVPPRTRRRLEDWLLLLLRCLALLLLALMFARPFWRGQSEAATSQGTAWCLLLDVSASMKREGAWGDAGKRVVEALAQIREQDHVMLATFDREPREILSFDAWLALPEGSRKAELKRLLDAVQPTWRSTDLGKALRFASSQFQGGQPEGSRRQRILLVSDLQEGAGLEALHADSWPDKISVTPLVVDAPWKDNLTLSAVSTVLEDEAVSVPAKGDSGVNGGGQTRVRVTSGRESGVEKFSLNWRGEAEKIQATVPSGGTRILPVSERKNLAADGTLDLTGDSLDFDNHLYMARPTARELRVLCLGAGLSRTDTRSPLFYLARALQPSAALKPVLVEKELPQLTRLDLPGTAMVIVFGEGNEEVATLLKEWALAGGNVVYVAQEGDKGTLVQDLTGQAAIKFNEGVSREALLQDLNFDHVMLRSFAEAGVRDFSKIRFWKHREILIPAEASEKATVLARFDDRSPAWVEWAVGRGRLLALGSGWAPGDSQLAVSSKFVPLIYGLLDWATGGLNASTGYVVGDLIPASAGNWQGTVSVTSPGGKTTLWDVARQPTFEGTQTPGIYRFGSGDAAQSVAVNLAAMEGRVAPMPPARLAELGVRLEPLLSTPVSAAAAADQIRLADAQEEQRQKVWKAVLLAVLVVLLMETWLAGRREGRSSETTVQPA